VESEKISIQYIRYRSILNSTCCGHNATAMSTRNFRYDGVSVNSNQFHLSGRKPYFHGGNSFGLTVTAENVLCHVAVIIQFIGGLHLFSESRLDGTINGLRRVQYDDVIAAVLILEVADHAVRAFGVVQQVACSLLEQSVAAVANVERVPGDFKLSKTTGL